MKKLLALVTIITVTLSGCATQQGSFPSLLKRSYENEPVMDEPVVPGAPISLLPADMQGKLTAAVAKSNAAHDQFQARLPVVQRQVDAARGAAVSSETWVVAHTELAALEILRSPSIEAVADIDALYRTQLEQESVADQSGGATIIAKQRDAVQAQVDRQQGDIDMMKNRLR